MTLCGHEKRVHGRSQPLVCTLESGHPGPHGIAVGGLPPYVRWAA